MGDRDRHARAADMHEQHLRWQHLCEQGLYIPRPNPTTAPPSQEAQPQDARWSARGSSSSMRESRMR